MEHFETIKHVKKFDQLLFKLGRLKLEDKAKVRYNESDLSSLRPLLIKGQFQNVYKFDLIKSQIFSVKSTE